MNQEINCKNCHKPIAEHTQDELIKCKIEIFRKTESPLSDEEITRQFNEIKSGEYARLQSSQKKEQDTP